MYGKKRKITIWELDKAFGPSPRKFFVEKKCGKIGAYTKSWIFLISLWSVADPGIEIWGTQKKGEKIVQYIIDESKNWTTWVRNSLKKWRSLTDNIVLNMGLGRTHHKERESTSQYKGGSTLKPYGNKGSNPFALWSEPISLIESMWDTHMWWALYIIRTLCGPGSDTMLNMGLGRTHHKERESTSQHKWGSTLKPYGNKGSNNPFAL